MRLVEHWSQEGEASPVALFSYLRTAYPQTGTVMRTALEAHGN